MKHWLWLGGWGLDVDWQRRQIEQLWPAIEHTILYPGELCSAKLNECCEKHPIDQLIGYSLGSFLILKDVEQLPEIPIVLLAPILDFKAEQSRGGRVDGRRLSILLRWLRRDAISALNDFYKQGGIDYSLGGGALPYGLDDLIWGIEQLRDCSVSPPSRKYLRGVLGSKDALLDADCLKVLWPDLEVLPGVGHDLNELLKGMK
ncbi:hypothetical protein [Rubellicoccus peritrichatus]|uniref:Alpha/beta hydrolase n=1 Tax=Rubellicoccus peritrichatus TaxID=3080537 RepID=A0AAQ3LDZ3_9BACT|nr:hypothetical protein [Puniceicoccus sp. CR14]WOO41818.1 hypothetical protein RZN69_01865 [Puniceicoccus sp. CR14]